VKQAVWNTLFSIFERWGAQNVAGPGNPTSMDLREVDLIVIRFFFTLIHYKSVADRQTDRLTDILTTGS